MSLTTAGGKWRLQSPHSAWVIVNIWTGKQLANNLKVPGVQRTKLPRLKKIAADTMTTTLSQRKRSET